MRLRPRIEHVSNSNIRRNNDPNQSNRRIQLQQEYEEESPVQSEVLRRDDSEVSGTFQIWDRESLDTPTVNLRSIGANADEAYTNIMAVPEPHGPLEISIHPLRLLRVLARDGDLVAGIILMEILTKIFQSAGVSEEPLQRLNRVVFQSTMNMNCKDCAICHDEFANDEEIIILPCGHPFSSGCISRWLGTSKHCPSCRANLDDIYLVKILY